MASARDRAARKRLILALDTASAGEARHLIEELREYVGLFKVGLELFCRTGPAFLEELHREDVPVFFDGKFMDIPNTVARATAAVTACGVSMFNVHASGGSRMMQAAVESSAKTCLEKGFASPISLAVTVLTSLGDSDLNDELGVNSSAEEQVCRLARLAKKAGVDGVVASAGEVLKLREACGPDFVLVTPGVRPSWSSQDDQVRIVTPADAMRFGSDYVVVGRPITAAPDRRDAAKRVIDEMEAALA